MKPLLVALASLSFSCTAAMPAFAAPTGETVTVFVHGYKGAFLEVPDADHTRAWFNIGDGTGTGDKTLALAYPGQRTPPSYASLVPAGPLTKFTVLPALVSEDIYLGWMEFGRDHLQGFVPFSYDWRQDVLVSGQALCDFLAKLPAKRIRIVAHSMGGLVTWSCLARNAEVASRVTKIVFAGTPFQGGPNIFDDLLIGTRTGRNRALLSREALFSFPSAWQLLSAHSGFFVDRVGAAVPVDAFDATQWVSRHWGVFESEADPADVAQLQVQLDHHAELHALLARPLLSAPSLLAVIGSGRQTVSGVRVVNGSFDFEDPPTEDGDGSVLLSSAAPPTAFTQFSTRAAHVALLSDAAVQKAIESFLLTD